MRRFAVLAFLLLTTVALAGCNSDKDTDEDGLPDAIEKRGWDILVYTMNESVVRHVTSDPEVADTDGDGLSDFDEVWVRGSIGPRLDPSNPDTDGDGLTDCYEWYVQVGDCPKVEGFSGYDYKNYVTDPSFMDSDLGSTSRYVHYVINDGQGFMDHEGHQSTGAGELAIYTRGDGLSDYDEIFGYTITRPDGSVSNGVRSDPSTMDTDRDGLEDGEEALIYGSEPGVQDTDGDGCWDGRDVLPTKRDTYRVKFHDFTLTDNPSGGGAQMMFVSAVAAADANGFRFQPTNGHESVSNGETISLDHLSGSYVARGDCTGDQLSGTQVAAAYRPWILVQVLAADKDPLAANNNQEAYNDGDITVLDIYSGLPSEATSNGQLYWNPQADVYRWSIPEFPETWTLEDDSEAFTLPQSGWFEFQGDNGKLRFKPEVRLL